ncbi:MAG: 4Fe-4S dicluster domain-containing protein, partial [Methanobacteriota archaeon]
MARYKLQVDTKKCIGCHSCEIACKQEFNLPVGPMPIRVLKIGPQKVKGELKTHYVPVFCKHCEDAPCIKACPEEALQKRDDGLVIVNKDKCTGCQIC